MQVLLPLGADIGDVAFDRMLDDVGLPIGNLTSQMFANLYLNELDQFCKHKLRLHFYIRYMDDIIILHDDKKYLEKVKQDIAVFLGKKLNLQLNNKTCIRPTRMGIEFVEMNFFSKSGFICLYIACCATRSLNNSDIIRRCKMN